MRRKSVCQQHYHSIWSLAQFETFWWFCHSYWPIPIVDWSWKQTILSQFLLLFLIIISFSYFQLMSDTSGIRERIVREFYVASEYMVICKLSNMLQFWFFVFFNFFPWKPCKSYFQMWFYNLVGKLLWSKVHFLCRSKHRARSEHPVEYKALPQDNVRNDSEQVCEEKLSPKWDDSQQLTADLIDDTWKQLFLYQSCFIFF